MSGRSRANIRKGIGFVVCALLCTALLASPGAWAQKRGEGTTPLQSDQSRDCSVSDATAQGDDSNQHETCAGAEPSGNDEADAPDQTFDAASAQANEPAREEVFKANIYIANKPYLVSFWVYDVAKHKAAVGTRTITSAPGAEYTYYKPVLYDKDISPAGPLRLPDTVTYNKNGINYTYTVAVVGDTAFHDCTKITTTGLAKNEHITRLEHCCYDSCNGLETTGFEDNHTIVDDFGVAVFQFCKNPQFKTGLNSNATITKVGKHMFQGCDTLTLTGLESNHTITTLDTIAFQLCSKLRTTGLEYERSAVSHLGDGVFALCPSLISTGLDRNEHIVSIGHKAFTNDASLGSISTSTANTGDLVLNGSQGKLSVGKNAFANTGYKRLYLGSNVTDFTCEEGALNLTDASVIPCLYVPDLPSWTSMQAFSFGSGSHKTTYSKSDGSLVVMAKPVSSQGASRVDGTSDEALSIFSSTRPFWVELSDDQGHNLGIYEPHKEGDSYTVTNQSKKGLVPSATILKAQVSSTRQGNVGFVYPVNVRAQLYNQVKPYEIRTPLAAISYTILFHSNQANEQVTRQTMRYGIQSRLQKNSFTDSLMSFGRWNSKDDGKGATYGDEQEVLNLGTKHNEEVHLYAQWDIGLYIKSEDTLHRPLQPGYTLSSSPDEPACGMPGLYSDPDKQNKIDTWPLYSDPQGVAALYWLSPGTYYLFNEKSPAGYDRAASVQTVVVDEKDGKPKVSVNGTQVGTYDRHAACLTLTFHPTPELPMTGNIPAGLVQGVGALMVVALSITLLRRLRRQRAR